jgi:Gamma-butyrobetaine hydroxylase-like, N-terminal
MAKDSPWPVQLRLIRAEKRLDIEFDDGKKFGLPAEYLRVESPSAEVQGHDPLQKITIMRSGSSSTTCTTPASIPGTTSTNSVSSNRSAGAAISRR